MKLCCIKKNELHNKCENEQCHISLLVACGRLYTDCCHTFFFSQYDCWIHVTRESSPFSTIQDIMLHCLKCYANFLKILLFCNTYHQGQRKRKYHFRRDECTVYIVKYSKKKKHSPIFEF